MRADTLVRFVTLGKMEYDYATGDHVQGPTADGALFVDISLFIIQNQN